MFEAAASRLERLPGSPTALLLACLGLVAAVTAVLNLDTAAVFMTPVLIATARRRRLDAQPFLYGSVFMANASSLFLPGSNLTNLLVRDARPRAAVSGGRFFADMLPWALSACLLTAAGLVLLHRGSLHAGPAGADAQAGREAPDPAGIGRRGGLWGALLAAVLIVLLADPALPVLALGVLLLALGARRGRLGVRAALRGVGAPSLVGLFLLAVLLGALARASSFPAGLVNGAGAPATALLAAGASVAVNNLPAAVLLSARGHPHLAPLLLGLNVGPNLAVTGSLAVLLWWRAARTQGIRPSALSYSRQGVLLTALALGGALLAGAR